ncbi:MAG: 2-dehydropantoate 2-reductase [Dehalococcoidia bacterium]|nr:2-dehydropantoate 2-reductase [Dehalococcoidia bacterium]
MKVAVIGIGGVGGYYGGRLAHRYPRGSEHEIAFFCRGAHREAIRRDGLKLIARDGELIAHPSIATDSAADLGAVDVALFAVKGYSLAEVARQVRTAVTNSTVVIPLGNGVDNDEVLKRELRSGKVLNGGVYISTHIEGPGMVEQTGGTRKLFFGSPDGEMEPYRPVEKLLRDAGIDATLSDHILRDVWTKFIFIDAISAVTSLQGVTIGTVLSTPEFRDLYVQLLREVQTLAARLNVGLPDAVVEQSVERAAAFPPDTKTSMQLDVERKSRTELDTMMGYVVRKGKEVGIPTPQHARVHKALSSLAG